MVRRTQTTAELYANVILHTRIYSHIRLIRRGAVMNMSSLWVSSDGGGGWLVGFVIFMVCLYNAQSHNNDNITEHLMRDNIYLLWMVRNAHAFVSSPS